MTDPDIAITPEVSRLMDRRAAVAVGVSGGKDSVACALAVDRHLKEVGYEGPKLLIHADLGRVEWKDSLPSCERLADKLGWELAVVARPSGDMLQRWEVRWENNVERYSNLDLVKLMLPWSTPGMRFCTSELKVAVICAELKRRFPDRDIINATGVRREESSNRAKMPVSQDNSRFARRGLTGLNWNPIIEWPIRAVYDSIANAGLELHEAYRVYGASRVSCSFCILSSKGDLIASSKCLDNATVYRSMVELEATSSFSFQSDKWLGDVAPELLTPELRERLEHAKVIAVKRQQLEAAIPNHLLLVAGFPSAVPTQKEAELLSEIRLAIADMLNLDLAITQPDQIREKYAALTERKGGLVLASGHRQHELVLF